MKIISNIILALVLSNYSLPQPGWVEQSFNETNFYSVFFHDSTTGWIVGNSDTIFKSTDAGENWSGYSYDSIPQIGNSINFVNENFGWIVGIESSISGTIHKSTDGGKNWIAQNTPLAGERNYLQSIHIVDTNIAWTVGAYFNPEIGWNKLILKTIDGGIDWIQQKMDSSISELRSVYFLNKDTGWVAGIGGDTASVFKTTDGGENWFNQQLTGQFWNVELRSIQFIDYLNGWAVGVEWTKGNFSPILYKTTDSGNNWIKKTLPLGNSGALNSINFTDINNGWIVGVGSPSGAPGDLIYRSHNDGENWIQQQSGTENGLWDLQMINEKIGWAVGLHGTILKTTNGGVTFMEENMIDYFPINPKLTQNYPNPFNPSTIIRYEIPGRDRNDIAFVTLKVYDVLGNEITTLANEEKPAGSYEIEFDGTGLASGIYFYRLSVRTSSGSARKYVETKKMVLIK